MKLKVLEQCRVSPPPGSVPESSLPLTFFDITFLGFRSIETCFFYDLPLPTSDLVESHIPNIKSSLSLTLQRFYLLASKVKPSPASNEHFEFVYTEGDSVSFTVVESQDDFVDLTGTHPRDFTRLQNMIPHRSDDSLLALQITLFPNHGICVGICFAHVACDGFSSDHFVRSWAAACKSKSNDLSLLPLPLPSFQREQLVAFHDYYAYHNSLRLQNMSSWEAFDEAKSLTPEVDESVSATIKLGPEEIKKLKKLARIPCSTFVATYAYLWICSVKALKLAADEVINFPLIADWRQRMQPQLPPMYFGNCISFSLVPVKVGDIVKEDGMKVASEAIGKAIGEFKEGIGYYFKKAMEENALMSLIVITGSPKFGIYETDFGWGRPAKFEMITNSNPGLTISASKDEAGGVEIQLVRSKKEMDNFVAVFNDGLQLP